MAQLFKGYKENWFSESIFLLKESSRRIHWWPRIFLQTLHFRENHLKTFVPKLAWTSYFQATIAENLYSTCSEIKSNVNILNLLEKKCGESWGVDPLYKDYEKFFYLWFDYYLTLFPLYLQNQTPHEFAIIVLRTFFCGIVGAFIQIWPLYIRLTPFATLVQLMESGVVRCKMKEVMNSS